MIRQNFTDDIFEVICTVPSFEDWFRPSGFGVPIRPAR
jgi:hypothetical protein